jgi:hypothetical protein
VPHGRELVLALVLSVCDRAHRGGIALSGFSLANIRLRLV